MTTTGTATTDTSTYETAVARVEEIIRRLDSGEAGCARRSSSCGRAVHSSSTAPASWRRSAADSRSSPSTSSSPPRRAGREAGGEHLRRALGPRGRHRRVGLEGLAPTSQRIRAAVDCRAPAWRGLEGVGEDVVYSADDQRASRRSARPEACPMSRAGGRSGSSVSTSTRLTCSSAPSPSTARSRVCIAGGRSTAPRSTSRCARPASAARGARSEPAPLTFVVSLRLGEPATPPRASRLECYPTLRFKLDATARGPTS